MTTSTSDRRFPRYEFIECAICMEVPRVSSATLEPENISWGGFEEIAEELDRVGVKLNLPDKPRNPKAGVSVKCHMEVLGEEFRGLAGKIVWIAQPGQSDPGWTLGMRITVPAGRMADFQETMKRLVDSLRLEGRRG
jgi:hypothetical protein